MIHPGDEPIPGYRLEKLLGRGQYGEVWRANTPGRSSVALKFLDLTGKHGRKEFRSAQRVKQIRHAHLMPIVAIWFLDRDGQILNDDAMESLSEEETASMKTLALSTVADNAPPPARMIIATPLGDMTLRDRMAECQGEGQEGIPVGELIDYMQEAAKGIDYLNSEQHDWRGSHVGVQHCDIKPDNIMLVGGSVMICDFGVAQVLADYGGGVRATSLSGSPAYMSPEAFEAKPCRTSDQYSLAVTYYELRTGQLPLHAESFAAVFEAHRSGKLDFSLVPKEEQAVLRRATQPDPERRFDSSGEFVQALRAVTIGDVVTSKSPWTWMGITAAVIAIALSVVAFSLWQWQAKTFKVKLHFDLPGANVLVNDKPYTADQSGSLEVKAVVNAPLSITCSGNEDRNDKQWTITAAEMRNKKAFDFTIPFTAEHHFAEAEKLLVAGKVNDAIESYALAIKAEPEKYARLPEPASLDIPGIVWGDCFQITPAGDALVVGGKDGVVRRWKIGKDGVESKSEELYQHDAPISNLVATDSLVASACEDGAIWIKQNGEAEQIEKGDGTETDLAITGDGEHLVAAVTQTQDLVTKVFAWDLASQSLKGARQEIGQQPGEFPRLIGAAEGSVVLATKDLESLVWRWRVDSKEHDKLGLQQNDIFSLSASADGRTIAYTGAANTSGETPEAAIVDVESKLTYQLASRQSDSIPACALRDDGRMLVTAERISSVADSGTVTIWRPDLGSRIAMTDRALQFDRNLGDVGALVMSSNAEWIAAGHDRGAVSLWRMSEKQRTPLLTIGAGDRVVAVRITPDQQWLVSGARDGRVMIFDLRRLEVLHQACEKAGVTPKIGEDKVT